MVKIAKKGVDFLILVRYNGGSLSKSPLRPLQIVKKARDTLRSLCASEIYSLRLSD